MASQPQTMPEEEELSASEKWQDGRIRTLCRGCGHPRSEHHSIYNAVAGDYIYTYCNESSCGCEEFVEQPTQAEAPPRHLNLNNPATDWETRCKVCGSQIAKHIQLGPECVAACEANWKMLDKMRRAGLINTVKV